MKTAFILTTFVLCALIIILISELVKQGKEIDTLHLVIEEQQDELHRITAELSTYKSLEHQRYHSTKRDHSQGGGGSKS